MEKSVIDFIIHSEDAFYDEVIDCTEYRKASDKAYKFYQQLKEMLSKEQYDVFEKFIEHESEREEIRAEKTFKNGVKCGVRFAAECLID